MINRKDLRAIARARIRDAEVLTVNGRHDGSVYLCGYAVELVLKARICRVLDWQGFPETSKEFHDLISFKTHQLAILLRLAGVERRIKAKYMGEWSIVEKWNPEIRYQPIGAATPASARDMIEAAKSLLRALQ